MASGSGKRKQEQTNLVPDAKHTAKKKKKPQQQRGRRQTPPSISWLRNESFN
jgi:hypothetical protein